MDNNQLDAKYGSIWTPSIASQLEHIVRYASGKMAPFFAVNSYNLELPRIGLGYRTFFKMRPKTLAFKLESLRSDRNIGQSDRSIGHEVSHWLHFEVNPGIFHAYKKNREASNLVELVGYYGGHVFSSFPKNHEIEETKKQIIDQIVHFDETLKHKIKSRGQSQQEYIDGYERHTGGGYAADFLFEEFGSIYLKKFALADVQMAKQLLKKLGYHSTLFIPYSPPEVLTIEDPPKIEEMKEPVVSRKN